ncbi:MAG: hypothetical protein WBK26_11795 [Burkholderiaceae bacterium]
MSYTAKLRIEVPAALYDTACAIARALDPDTGGHLSYGPRIEDATRYVTDTPCTPAFAAQATAMLQDPALLHAVVSADYASRWADLVPPTLAECEAFCAGAVVSEPTATPAEPTPPA